MSGISTEQIETLLKNHPEVVLVDVAGDGKHFSVTIVSDAFVNLSKVQRQLWVYGLLNSYIVSGELHAIQMNTWTEAEWQQKVIRES